MERKPKTKMSAIEDVFNQSLNSNLSSISINFASTPFKVPAAKKTRGKKKSFVRPVCDTCNICGKEYRCHRSYVDHMRKHTIKEAASRYPSTTSIIEHCMDSFPETLDKMRSLPAFGAVGKQYQELIDYLRIIPDLPNSPASSSQWKEFFEVVHGVITSDLGEYKILLPSALVGVLMKNCDNLLSDPELRKNLGALLQACTECNISVCHCFVADYVLILVTKILKYYASCLKSAVVNSLQDGVVPVVLDGEDLETIHYISGSVVRGFYKKSEQFPRNVGWSNIQVLILNKLLESDTVPGPPESVKGWTMAKNRGRLFFVSGALFDFFCGVAQILKKCTQETSRVDSSKVIESVCQGEAILLWDDAVGSDFLSESASYDLMCGMTKSFSNTYGGGHMKKLLNDIRKNKAEASLPLRARVAPRSKP